MKNISISAFTSQLLDLVFWSPLPILMNTERNIFSSNFITLLALGFKVNLCCQKLTFIPICLLSYCVLKFSTHKNQTSNPPVCGD